MKVNSGDTDRLSDEQLETLLEVVFLAALADEQLGAGEQERIRDHFERLGDGRMGADRLQGLMLEAAVRLEREGRDARLRHAKDVLGDRDACEIALALAADVAAADGLEDRERESLLGAAEALGVGRDWMRSLIESR